jgi:precorrin-6y C5,15-methyltransferase (decarboxylating) CbiE subunit
MALTIRPITIVGCGPGGPDYLTEAARGAVQKAGLLIGARRLLELFPESVAERVTVGADIDSVLQTMEDYLDRTPMVVLVTGDPGLHSLAQPIVRRFGRDRCRILPGISSVQAAFAAAGLDWMEARVLSAHGALPQVDPEELKSVDKIAILAGSPAALHWISELAASLGPRRVLVCEDLTLPREKVTEVQAGELAGFGASSRTVVLILRPEVLVDEYA